MLLSSGIRPTAHVADHRIEMQADRPGRGTNLQDRRAVGPAGLLHRSAGCRTRSSIICRCCCATHPTWKACRRAICISTDRSAAIKQLIMTFGVDTRHSASDVETDDMSLDDQLRQHFGGNRHPGGSRRMGEPFNPKGDEGHHHAALSPPRVCDALLLSPVPCPNLGISAFMIPEMIVTTVRAGRLTSPTRGHSLFLIQCRQ